MEYQEIEIAHKSKHLPVLIPLVDNLFATIHGHSDDPRLQYILSPSALDTIEYKRPKHSTPFSYQHIYRLDGLLHCHYIQSKQADKNKGEYKENYPFLGNKVTNANKNHKTTYFISLTKHDGKDYPTPKFAKHAYIDLANKDYSYRPGKLFNFIALATFSHAYENQPFTLENYIDYEYRTCINLALEITAAYGQFKEQINAAPTDPVLNKLSSCAFSHFSEHYLPFLVCSPYIFTRSILAHQYFQQLLNNYRHTLSVKRTDNFEMVSPCTYFLTIDGRDELDLRVKK